MNLILIGSEVRENNEIQSGERKHVCPECEKGFTKKSYLRQHMLIHSGEKKFVCPTCSTQFRQKSHLNQHLRIHTGLKPFECHTCYQQFRLKSSLNRHMLIHSGDKPYECPQCQKCFTLKGNFKSHLKIHSNVRTNIVSCNSCQKGFLLRGSLIRHLRLHTGIQPFACDICKKGFAQKINLVRHLRVHSGDKPFRCSTCNKAFIQRSSLKRHLKIHSSKQQGKHSLTMKSSSTKAKELFQQYDELLKRFGCFRNVKVFCYKLTDDMMTSKGYSENVEKAIDDGLEQNESDPCFKVPLIKEESNPEDELADEPTPSTSYQNVLQEVEPNENADATCINQFDDSFVKEETIFIGNISTVKKEFEDIL